MNKPFLSLVRYYLPSDNKQILFEKFKKKVAEGDIIIITHPCQVAGRLKILFQLLRNAKEKSRTIAGLTLRPYFTMVA